MNLVYFDSKIKVAIFPWKKNAGKPYQEQCIRALAEDQNIKLLKNEDGKPYLENSDLSISISHSSDQLAIALSGDHSPGVDIEHLRSPILRIAEKVFSYEEISFVKHYPLLEAYHILWGAKECIYKSYGKKGLGFIKDIRVFPFEFHPKTGMINALLMDEILIELQYLFMPHQTILVHTLSAEKS